MEIHTYISTRVTQSLSLLHVSLPWRKSRLGRLEGTGNFAWVQSVDLVHEMHVWYTKPCLRCVLLRLDKIYASRPLQGLPCTSFHLYKPPVVRSFQYKGAARSVSIKAFKTVREPQYKVSHTILYHTPYNDSTILVLGFPSAKSEELHGVLLARRPTTRDKR